MAFPASKYVRYKRATAFFLDWLLRARGHQWQDKKRVQLDTLNDVVTEISSKPSTLLNSPNVLQEFPKALAACQCAITLREHVASFFADAEHGHQHFLDQLRKWLDILKKVVVEDDILCTTEVESTKYENYYEVLEMDEDYFPDEGMYVPEPSIPKTFKVERQRLLEEVFAEDMRLEVVYLFVELQELVDTVFETYQQVKTGQRSIFEATVVTKLALDTANSLTATLQLRYPSLRTAAEFFRVLMKTEANVLNDSMARALLTSWANMQLDGVYKPAPGLGMFLTEFGSVANTLQSFTLLVPPNIRLRICLPQGYFRENYDENRTPQYLLPDLYPGTRDMVIFILQNLSELYNTLAYAKATTFNAYDTKEIPDWRLAGAFMTVMDKYFSSHEVTVSTVFACLCWIKSVAALQGNGDLCQTTNITLNHTTDLMNQIDASVAKGAVKAVDKQLHGFLEYYSETIKTSAQYSHLAYTNPLLAGLTMLDHHLEYMDLASEVMAASKLCSFGHLYNALVNEGLCCRIPFFEEILVIYEKMIFTPSRAAAVRGAYVRMYLLNSGFKVASLDALVRGKRLVGSTADNTKSRTRLYMNEVSKIYRLMTQDDKSFLRAGSSKSLLNMATEVCSQELYDSRVLSRDMLKLHDDLTDTFSEMRGMLTESDIRFSSDEDEVTLRLLRICDILQPNDELDVSLLRGNHHPRIDKATRAMCKKAAEVIEVKFGGLNACEDKYFKFTARLNGSGTCGSDTSHDIASENMIPSTGKPTKKKKNKRKKKKTTKGKKSDNAIKVETNKAETVTRLGEDDGSAELSAMLKQLLVSVSAGTNALDETNTTILQDSLRQAATGAFSRLRDPDIPPFLKVDDAQSVCKVVAKLQELAEKFSDPRRQDATTLCVRQFIFAESSRVIHMMKRFHRTDHPAMTVPVLAKVRELCTPKPDFVQFVISVAHIGVSAGRTVEAREILDLLEKCLLQMRHCKLKDPYYREMVQQYSTARDAMGMGLTSSPDSFRILEWYLTNAMSNMQALVSLDAMDGQPFYLEMVTSAFQDTSELERGLHLPGIACFGNCLKHVVYGGPKESVARARDLVIEVAKTAGVEFSESNSQQCATSVRVNEFKFSSSGIIRDTAP